MLAPLKVKETLFLRPLRWLIALFMGGTLIGGLLLINIFQMLSFVLVRPFSLPAFRTFNRGCAWLFWFLCVVWQRDIFRIDVVITGDDVPSMENVMIVCNHQEMPDIMLLMNLAIRKGRLGDMKWYVKDSLKYVPAVGWGMLFLDCIFLKRDWLADKNRVMKTFETLNKFRVPYWLISFSEGTRITAAKHAKSQEHARQRSRYVPQHTMTPRTKGFTASVTALRERMDAVYDITIGYEEGVPSIGQMAQGFVKRAHLHVRRFPTSELPLSEEELALWLIKRFEEKDELLDRYYRTGKFPGKRLY